LAIMTNDRDYEQIRDAIEQQAPSQRVLAWIERVVNDVVAGRLPIAAVRHPLGFVCLPVSRTDDDGACVHLWSPDWRPATLTTSTTHCHSWDLLSYVIHGRLRNRVVRVVDAPSVATHRVFEVRSGPAGDDIRATARLVRSEPGATSVHGTGDVYRLPAGVFHQSLPDADVIATLAFGSGRPGATDLSLGALGSADHHVRREVCDHEATIQAAELVLGLLSR
jgi:hypothetical protein